MKTTFINKILFLIFLILVAGCKQNCGLPAESDVCSMDAIWSNEKMEKFKIVTNDYSKVLNLFKKNKLDSNPAKWMCMGTINIKTKNNTNYYLHLFWTYKKPGAFRVNDKYYRGLSDDIVYQNFLIWYSNSFKNTNSTSQ